MHNKTYNNNSNQSQLLELLPSRQVELVLLKDLGILRQLLQLQGWCVAGELEKLNPHTYVRVGA
jgi:hypothetical protein